MKEPRRFVRISAHLPVVYRVLPSALKMRSTTCDVAGSGISLLLQEPLMRGAQVQLEVTLPDRERSVLATGEVVWCEHQRVVSKADQHELTKAGVRFLHVDPEDHDALIRYVAAHLPLG